MFGASLIGTHGSVKPEKKPEGSQESLYTYGARMRIVTEGTDKTLETYRSAQKKYGAGIKLIIAGSQGPDGSQHLVETAEMVAPIFGNNIAIEEHPGAILPYLDLEEVFGKNFISIVEGYVSELFAEEDSGIRQKITFKFLQALFEGKIEKGVSIEIHDKKETFYLPVEIITAAAPGKIRDAQLESKAKNKENVANIVERINAAHGQVLVIASKEQVTHIARKQGVLEENIPKPENNRVFSVNAGTMKQISD